MIRYTGDTSDWANLSKGVLAIPARVIAACFALVGFASAAVAGVAVQNSATTILLRATVVMLLCWVVGRVAGAIAQQAIDEHITGYEDQHPVSEAPTSAETP